MTFSRLRLVEEVLLVIVKGFRGVVVSNQRCSLLTLGGRWAVVDVKRGDLQGWLTWQLKNHTPEVVALSVPVKIDCGEEGDERQLLMQSLRKNNAPGRFPDYHLSLARTQYPRGRSSRLGIELLALELLQERPQRQDSTSREEDVLHLRRNRRRLLRPPLHLVYRMKYTHQKDCPLDTPHYRGAPIHRFHMIAIWTEIDFLLIGVAYRVDRNLWHQFILERVRACGGT